MTYTRPNPAEVKAHWDRMDEMAVQHGRAIIAIPREDEAGNPQLDKNGNVLADFSYTYGNRQTGDAELLTFYPAQRTANAVLNRLSKALEEGRLPYPQHHQQMVCAEGLLGETNSVVMYHALNTDQRAFANERYTCGHWKDEENIPILHVIIPMPDGNFLPVTPQPLMPTQDFDVVEAQLDTHSVPELRPNYIFRLTEEPDTKGWGVANMQMTLTFIDRVTLRALYFAQLMAKKDGGAPYNISLELAFWGAADQAAKTDPWTAKLIGDLDEETQRQMMKTICNSNDFLRFADDVIYFEGEV